MKKALWFISIALMISLPAYGWIMAPVVGGVAAVGGTEYTVYITDNSITFNSINPASVTIINGVTDTLLKEGNPTTNYGSTGILEVSKYDAGDHSHTLIKFPTATIPGTATVTSIEMGIYWTGGSAGTRTMKMTALSRAWVPAEATWNIYSTGNNWTTAGALSDGNDRAALPALTSQTISNTAGAWVTYNGAGLVTLVQAWIDGGTTNNGLHLERDDGSNDSTYNNWSSNDYDDGQRPYLKVVYEN